MSSATGMTFSSLEQDIKDYVERGSDSDTAFLRQLPRIINNAERSLADKMKIQGYRFPMTGACEAENQYVAKPSGWRNTVTFSIGTDTDNATFKVLRPRSYEYLRIVSPDPTSFDQPSWYTDYDFNNWVLFPTPDQAYPFEVIVYKLPDLLSDANQTNYLTQLTPNLLLFECLTNTEPFLRNDPRMSLWKEMRDDEMKGINLQEIRKMVDRGQTRDSV